MQKRSKRLQCALALLTASFIALTSTSGRVEAAKTAAKQSKVSPTITEAHIQRNFKKLNFLRAQKRLPLLTLDSRLNAFALEGSLQLMRDHIQHGHFHEAFRNGTFWTSGFLGRAGENQGDPNGSASDDVETTIDAVLQTMMEEGPGGGHYENILSPIFTRVGIGLALDPKGRLYFTNDFSQ